MSEHIIYKLGPFEIPGIEGERYVRVYLPTEKPGPSPAPVLYMFDGQNIFHDDPSHAGGWYLHHAVKELARRGESAPVIVGIDHGGATRCDELSPFPTRDSRGDADYLLTWLTEELCPRILKEFGVRSDAAGAAVGGSSLGGLAALYAHFRYPEVFGAALCMSPALCFAGGRLFDYIASRPVPWTSRLYIDAGAREDNGAVLADADRLVKSMRARGYNDETLCFCSDRDGSHGERDWRKRAPRALSFLFSGGAGRKLVELERAA
jgi:predicted alpha/beta superfamily hydrolase